ncbi:MAG: 30S ribosomal protein S4 [Candidatus Falkowbacteria bacterium]
MAKDLNPKCKQCRRAGEKLLLKGERCNTPKCAIVKRNFPPGFHGSKGKKRMTDYGLQLAEKQKAKRQYNLTEKQFTIFFERARRRQGNLGENFLKLLEMRLDNVIYRLGLASSRNQARQFVGHGLFSVNERMVNIPSYIVRAGEVIKIKSNKKEAKVFSALSEKLKNFNAPGWLSLKKDTLEAKIIEAPKMDMIRPNFNIQMIVEYYSR